ncbi:hypothetical protein WMF31_19965 [Sorangium sp. So ce1036]|uniref:hypothetical protein n=1 Tax=Sorangium sp. So ce1036 TaxID=3133328 RepID=UPI003F0D472A
MIFPGKLARRVIWSSRIQLAAERDAADLVRTPFPEDEPALIREEIRALRDKIELLRVTQSRWQAAQQRQAQAVAMFEGPAAPTRGAAPPRTPRCQARRRPLGLAGRRELRARRRAAPGGGVSARRLQAMAAAQGAERRPMPMRRSPPEYL